jgi:hypothetical protein
MRWLVRLYPPGWRERYEKEFVAMLEEGPITPAIAFDVCRGAADAWLRGPRGPISLVGIGPALAGYVIATWVLSATRRAWLGPADGPLETIYQSLYWFLSILFMTWLASRPSLRCELGSFIARFRR